MTKWALFQGCKDSSISTKISILNAILILFLKQSQDHDFHGIPEYKFESLFKCLYRKIITYDNRKCQPTLLEDFYSYILP